MEKRKGIGVIGQKPDVATTLRWKAVDFAHDHRTKLEQPHLARQFQHPHEQRLNLLEKAPAKRRDAVLVRMIVGGSGRGLHSIVRRLTHHIGCEGTIVTSQSPPNGDGLVAFFQVILLSTPMSWALFAQLSRTRSTNGAKALGSVKVTDSVKSISTDLISWRLTAPMNAS
jgi:hypothetical protein